MNNNQCDILKNHFIFFYKIIAEQKLTKDSNFHSFKKIHRALSGIPHPFNNAVIGSLSSTYNWDSIIAEQLDYFNNAKMPFVWYVDEIEENADFKKALTKHGFQNIGTFQGVIGSLNSSLPPTKKMEGYVLESIKDESSMDEFNDLVCSTFDIKGISKDLYRALLWNISQGKKPMMYHWVARKNDKIVAALSTLIDGDMVSFWNGATDIEFRRCGLSTALRHVALNDAISKGCHTGASYLMSEAMALGICKRLGYEPKWYFNVFLSPSS